MLDKAHCITVDENKIDAILAELDHCHSPGVALGIAIGGRPVYRKAFGVGSVELPLVLSPTVRMRIASITKHFTCLAYLLLCEKGRAKLDDPVGKYLPRLHPVARRVTIQQLMGHTAGLRDAHDLRQLFSGTVRPVSAAELVSFYEDIDSINFEPGRSRSYNNGSYLLLSATIERIADRPLEDVLRTGVLEPVGLFNTLLRRWDTDYVPNSASPHVRKEGGGFERSSLNKEHVGEGGLVSTVDDMLRWLAHMDAPTVGTRATWEAIKSPVILSHGTSTRYGLGLAIGRYRGLGTLSHSGALPGCNAHMVKVPAAGLDVVVMANRHDVSGVFLAYAVIDACVQDLNPLPPLHGRPLASGVLRSATTGRVMQLFAQEGQQVISINGWDVAVAPDAAGALHPLPAGRETNQFVTLAGDPKAPTSVRFHDSGASDELKAVPAFDRADLRTIGGRYRAESTDAEATICEEGMYLNAIGRFGSARYKLEPLAKGIWRARSVGSPAGGGVLTFADHGEGFCFSSERTWALSFRRY